ncbi:MAG: radical SAM protein [Desulfobacula sp.]|jgi:hypothetical protein
MIYMSKFQRGVQEGDKFDNRLQISIVAISSPGHYTLWNALSAETLAGDLRGHFAGKVVVSVLRVRTENEFCDALLALKNTKPDLLGISVECGGLETSLRLVQELYGEIWANCEIFEAPGLVFGGKIPTYFPELFITRFPSSIVVIGEGEIPFRRIIQRYFDNVPESFDKIPNLAYMGQMGNFTCTNVEQPSSSNLFYPPSTDTVPELLSKGAGTIMVQASRGCSWSKCSYCTVRSFRGGKKWESLPWSRTRKHMESLVSLGVREFEFCDDEFLGGRNSEHLERAHSIAEDLSVLGKAFKNGIAFRIFLTPHIIFNLFDQKGNKNINLALENLKQAGLVRVYFGIESGSEEQLNRYCRGTPVETVVGALDTLRKIGVGIDCGFIMFDPVATLNDIDENIRFFRKHGLVENNQWPFRPMLANQGAIFGQTFANSGMPPDQNFMCYRYKFQDEQVQQIYDIVDTISEETRSLFYTLKVISKAHFDPLAETPVTKFAREVVIQNAQIYLDLMDNLVNAIGKSDADSRISIAALEARHRIMELVKFIAYQITNGILSNIHRRVFQEISKLLLEIGITHEFDFTSANLLRSVS